jgi:DNA-binding HxlR family transcriptional regulator
LEIIGGKWRLPIIWELSAQESMRYNELKRRLNGITNIMLTRALQGLEKHNLVTRTEYQRIPPHVEYSITESCRQLLPALEIINQWGKEQMLPIDCEAAAAVEPPGPCPLAPKQSLTP